MTESSSTDWSAGVVPAVSGRVDAAARLAPVLSESRSRAAPERLQRLVFPPIAVSPELDL